MNNSARMSNSFAKLSRFLILEIGELICVVWVESVAERSALVRFSQTVKNG